jgi:hypothetical protein
MCAQALRTAGNTQRSSRHLRFIKSINTPYFYKTFHIVNVRCKVTKTGNLDLIHSNVCFTASRPALGPIQPPIKWVPVIKRPEREADHSPPSTAEVKNEWSCSSTPPYAFVAWCSVKHRDNFTCTFTFYVLPVLLETFMTLTLTDNNGITNRTLRVSAVFTRNLVI